MHEHDEYEYNYDNLGPTWNYEEFSHLERIKDSRTPYARGYLTSDGEFYIEPWFYTQLTRLLERFPGKEEAIMEAFFTVVAKAPKVLFTRDINDPSFVDDEYLYVEITEVAIAASLEYDDISRGSDYGD